MNAVFMVELWPLVTAFGVALGICLAVVATQGFHGRFTMDSAHGIQKLHVHPTPRVGGIGIYLGLLAATFMLKDAEAGHILRIIEVAGLPALGCGLLEDVTKRVGVLPRLLATMFSGFLAWAATGIALNELDIILIDDLLLFAPAGVLLTAFAVGGVANAINIIDGCNGLAAGTSVIALLALGAIAHGAGDASLGMAAIAVAAAVTGFWLVNFPFGKLFLGDGGAYFTGFALAWLTILLAMRNPAVSSWAGLMVCAYPVIEVVFSIIRRRRRRLSAGHADRLHLHSLVNRRFTRRLLPNASSTSRNSATGALMWLAALLPASIALLWPTDTPTLICGFVACAFLYSVTYVRLTQFRWGTGLGLRREAPAALPLSPVSSDSSDTRI